MNQTGSESASPRTGLVDAVIHIFSFGRGCLGCRVDSPRSFLSSSLNRDTGVALPATMILLLAIKTFTGESPSIAPTTYAVVPGSSGPLIPTHSFGKQRHIVDVVDGTGPRGPFL